ncbi:chloride channel protein [Anaerolinea sp.]|uniref:chloride channel protein n=1 Tax=Anaerolinea sp. TaxID=1872519 RepID=UPI002ACD76BD|nr:chloride channel protein [Anaerolinea sp.]
MVRLVQKPYNTFLYQNEAVFLGSSALLVGLAGGLGIWIFKQMIAFFQKLAFDLFAPRLSFLGSAHFILIPVLGGLLVGVLSWKLIGEERHHGVAGIIEAVALAGGRLHYQRIPAKSVASALSIGFGASVGPEDPSVQIGANLGSWIGKILHLSEARVRVLVAAGAASGISAAFNAPIAGVFFAIEIILGELGGSTPGIVLLATIASAALTQALTGSEPAFHVPAYAFHSLWEFPIYLSLGALAGVVSAVYIHLIYLSQDFFHRLSLPKWLKPALAGSIVGITGIFLPQIFGVGYGVIEAVLNGRTFPWIMLIALMVARLLLTPISVGGGFIGGVFAPALFIGVMLGTSFGQGAAWIFRGLNLSPAAFGLAGMAAVLAGAIHAPLTAILLLFEMTQDYRIILPLMGAVAMSLLISRKIQPYSVYSLGLIRKGIRIQHGRDIDVLEELRVSEVMEKEFPSLYSNDPLTLALDLFQNSHRHGIPVLDDQGKLAGILTIQDLQEHLDSRLEEKHVGDICTRSLEVTYPDESLSLALRKMSTHNIGRLPVVDREDPQHLVGLLRRADIIRAYDIALTQRELFRHRAQQACLNWMTPSSIQVYEFNLCSSSPWVGKAIQDIPLPENCLIVSLTRHKETFVPRGNTILKGGDTLVVTTRSQSRENLERFLINGEFIRDL